MYFSHPFNYRAKQFYRRKRVYSTRVCKIIILIEIIFISLFCGHELLITAKIRDPSVGWTIDDSISPNDLCDFCFFDPENDGTHPNSSPRDIVLTCAFHRLYNLHVFVRTLRTTGCKARIIVITDKPTMHSYPPYYYQALNNCGMQFICIDEEIPVKREDVFFFRHCLFTQFLEINKGLIDRVIVADMYDTIFQHDPFTEEFDRNIIYFSSERMQLTLRSWVRCMEITYYRLEKLKIKLDMNRGKFNQLMKNDIINGGLQAGGVENMIKFFSTMTKVGEPAFRKAFGDDQAFMNIFIYSHVFDDMFNYTIDEGDSGFLSTASIFRKVYEGDFISGDAVGEYKCDGRIPAVLHQYERFKNIVENVLLDCPNNDPYIDDYIRIYNP